MRFSHGLAPLAEAARAHGMELGLWYGPDSSNGAANWERDADRLLSYYSEAGIRYFKIDSSCDSFRHQDSRLERQVRGKYAIIPP